MRWNAHLALVCYSFIVRTFGTINCGEGLWHQGFNPNSGITFSVMDVSTPGSDGVHIALGGSSTDAADMNINVSNAGHTNAAIILIFDIEVFEPHKTAVISQLTFTNASGASVTVKIEGVRAIKMRPGDNKAIGVFEPEAGTDSMILFKLEGPLKTFVIPQYETGYGCSINNNHLVHDNDTQFMVVFQSCADDTKTFVALIDTYWADVSVGDIYETIASPQNIIAVDQKSQTHYLVVLERADGLLVLTLGNPYTEIPPPSQWTAQPVCASYMTMADFASFRATGNTFTPISAVIISVTHAVVALEENVSSSPGSIAFIAFSSDEATCASTTTATYFEDPLVSRQFKIKSYQVHNNKESATLFDTVSGTYYHLYDFDSSLTGSTYQIISLSYDSYISTAYRDIMQAGINTVFFDVSNNPVALKDQTLLQQQTSADACFELITIADNLGTFIEIDISLIVSDIADTWNLLELNGTYSPHVDTFGDSMKKDKWDISDASYQERTVGNPCEVEIISTPIADDTYTIGQPVYTITSSPAATTLPTCPTNTQSVTLYMTQINRIEDSNGLEVSATDFITVNPYEFDVEIDSAVNSMSDGVYTVYFIEGLLGESEYELATKVEQSFVLTVLPQPSPCVPDLTLPPNMVAEYRYKVGDPADGPDLSGISNGLVEGCGFTANVYDTDTDLISSHSRYIITDLGLDYIPLWWEFASINAFPQFSWYTNDLSDVGIKQLYFKMVDNKLGTVMQFNFEVDIYDNPCDSEWLNVPADNAHDSVYNPIIDPPLVIYLTSMSCNECDFIVSTYDTVPPNVLDPLLVAVTQPVTSSIPSASDVRMIQVDSDAFITIDAANVVNNPVGTYTVYVNLARNRSQYDTVTNQFTFTLTITSPDPCVPDLILPPNMLTEYRYKVGDPAAGPDLSGLSNGLVGGCGFTANVYDKDTDLISSHSRYIITDLVLDQVPIWWECYSVATIPSFTWYTTDLTDVGIKQLYFKMVDDKLGTVIQFNFEVDIYDNPCDSEWLNVPIDYALDSVYDPILDPPLVIPLNMSCNECDFIVSTYRTNPPNVLDPLLVAVTQPVTSSIPLAEDVRMIQVDNFAFITIDTANVVSNPVGTYWVYVLLARNRSPYDTVTNQFTFTLTITSPDPCVPNLTLPPNILTEYRYKVGDPAEGPDLSGLSNGLVEGCGFTAKVYDADTDLIASNSRYIITDLGLVQIPVWWEFHSVATIPSFTWYTTDLTDVGIKQLYFKMVDDKLGTEMQFNFEVDIYDNPCDTEWLNVPVDNALDTIYDPIAPPLVIPLTSMSCDECDFIVSTYDTVPPNVLDPLLVAVTQPQTNPKPSAQDDRVIFVLKDAFITIDTANVVNNPVGTYTVYVNLARNRSQYDTVTNQFIFDLTVTNPSPCVSALTLPSFPAPDQQFMHKIGWIDPQVNVFTGTSNGNCVFSGEIQEINGNIVDPVFQYVDVIHQLVPPLWAGIYFAVTDAPSLSYQPSSTDYSLVGIHYLKLVMTSIISGEQAELPFSVDIVDNPCVGSWTNVPTNGELNQVYVENTPPLTIELTGTSFGQCFMNVLVYDTTPETIQPFVTVTQPTYSIVTAPGQNVYDDDRVLNMDVPASFVFDPNSASQSNAGIYIIYVQLERIKNPEDILTTFFTFTITVETPADCTPDLTLPTNIDLSLPYRYKIGEPAFTIDLDQTIQNNDCGFTIGYVNVADNLAINNPFFIVVDTVFNNELPIWWEYRSISSYPSIGWYSTDASKAYQVYNLKQFMVDDEAGTYLEQSFSVEVIDNPCEANWTMPEPGSQNTTHEAFTGYQSQDLDFNAYMCSFTVSVIGYTPVLDTTYTEYILSDYFTIMQSTFSVIDDPLINTYGDNRVVTQEQFPKLITNTESFNNTDAGHYFVTVQLTRDKTMFETVSQTTNFIVKVEIIPNANWCQEAVLTTTGELEDFTYTASNTALVVDIFDMHGYFYLLEPHEGYCNVSYSLNINATSGEINEEWLVFDDFEGTLTVETEVLVQGFQVTYELTSIVGVEPIYNYASLTFTIDIKPTPAELDLFNQAAVVEEVVEPPPAEVEEEILEPVSEEAAAYLFLFDWYSRQTAADSVEPLTARIQGISQTGELTIKFNQVMLIEPTLKRNDDSLDDEMLRAIFPIQQIIDLRVMSDQYEGENLYKIEISNYELVSFERKTLKLQVNFNHPEYISIDITAKEILRVKFIENWLFMSENFQSIAQGTILNADIDQQMSQETAQFYEELGETVASAFDMAGIINFVVCIAMSYALKYLWSMVGLFQFLVFVEKWQLSYPTNALVFLRNIKNLVLMEFIPTEEISLWMTDKLGLGSQCEEDEEDCELETEPEAESSSDTIDNQRRLQEDSDSLKKKIGSSNIILNLGIMLIIALAIVLFLVIFRLLKFIVFYKYEWYKTYMTIQEKIFYNLFIRYILQSGLKIQIGACTTLMLLVHWSNAKEITQGSIAVTILVVTTLCPVWFGVVLYKNFDNLNWLSVNKRIGTMYAGAYLDDSVYPLTYSIVYLVRRILFVFLTFSLSNYPGMQAQVIIFSSVLYIIYLNFSRIYNEHFTMYLENLNEVFFLIILYHLLLFANLIKEPSEIENVGKSMILGVCFILGVGILVILGINVKVIIRSLKLRKMKNARNRIIMKRDLALQKIQGAISIYDDWQGNDTNSVLNVQEERKKVIKSANRQISMIGQKLSADEKRKQAACQGIERKEEQDMQKLIDSLMIKTQTPKPVKFQGDCLSFSQSSQQSVISEIDHSLHSDLETKQISPTKRREDTDSYLDKSTEQFLMLPAGFNRTKRHGLIKTTFQPDAIQRKQPVFSGAQEEFSGPEFAGSNLSLEMQSAHHADLWFPKAQDIPFNQRARQDSFATQERTHESTYGWEESLVDLTPIPKQRQRTVLVKHEKQIQKQRQMTILDKKENPRENSIAKKFEQHSEETLIDYIGRMQKVGSYQEMENPTVGSYQEMETPARQFNWGLGLVEQRVKMKDLKNRKKKSEFEFEEL